LVTSCVGNAFLKYVIEGQIKGRIDVTGRRGRRRKQPLANVKERRGYCKFIVEALDRAVCRTRCERGSSSGVRTATESKNEQENDERINHLNAELNPICYLLALLAHHFLHVSRIIVKSLTLRLLMSYIYIYIYIYIYMERIFLMFLDHTQRRSTLGRTPLDE